jgi:hypothetical protein
MLDHNLDSGSSILYLRPKGALAKEDFEQLARVVDPHIEKTGGLAGLILEAAKFPGWDSVGALAAHLRFVREHHKHIKKLAIVTDSAIGNLGEKLASHFVAAEIKHFPAGQLEAAKRWVMAR